MSSIPTVPLRRTLARPRRRRHQRATRATITVPITQLQQSGRPSAEDTLQWFRGVLLNGTQRLVVTGREIRSVPGWIELDVPLIGVHQVPLDHLREVETITRLEAAVTALDAGRSLWLAVSIGGLKLEAGHLVSRSGEELASEEDAAEWIRNAARAANNLNTKGE